MGPSGPVVTGIGDFSPHTVNGDPMMDVTGAVAFLELEPYAEAAQDSAWLEAVAVRAPRSGYGALDRRLSPLLRVLLLQLPRVRSGALRLVPAATRACLLNPVSNSRPRGFKGVVQA